MADQISAMPNPFNPFKQLSTKPIYGGDSPCRPRTTSLNSNEVQATKLFEASMAGTTAEEFLP